MIQDATRHVSAAEGINKEKKKIKEKHTNSTEI
jgi:hypothetical protein